MQSKGLSRVFSNTTVQKHQFFGLIVQLSDLYMTTGKTIALTRQTFIGNVMFSVQKTKGMASSPITSWQIDGETVETVSNFILGGSKITADGDCSHEIKRHLLLGRKALTKLDSILKSRQRFD